MHITLHSMKAAVINQYGSPDVFEIETINKPVPKPHEVLIRVYASSINPVDWKIRKGNWRLLLIAKFPVVLGFDAAGEVIETGAKVTRFKPGDRVYSRLDRKFGGAYAEYAVGSENTFSFIPSNLTYKEAAALPLAGVSALQALRDKGKIASGKKVLVNGASGGVGHFAIQIAKILGGEVTAVSSSRHKNMMDTLKPHHWIDYTKKDFLDLPEMYDLIFDVIGNKNFLLCRKKLTPGGIYVTSLPRPKIILHRFVSWFTTKKVKGFLMKSDSNDLDILSSYAENDKLKIYIDKVYPLEKIAEAHMHSQSGKAEGKIVLEIQ